MLVEDDPEDEMPERTLGQIGNEIDQAAKRISDAKMTLKAAQDDLRTLIGERNQIETDLLEGTGIAPSMLESTRDGHQVVSRRGRSATPKKEEEGPSTKELRAWAAETGWTYQGESMSKWPNRIPKDVLKELEEAFQTGTS